MVSIFPKGFRSSILPHLDLFNLAFGFKDEPDLDACRLPSQPSPRRCIGIVLGNERPCCPKLIRNAAWDLLCLDVSEPAEHRMKEMLYHRLKPEERQTFWGKSVGKTIEVGISKIRHGDNGGKATLVGKIIAAK